MIVKRFGKDPVNLTRGIRAEAKQVKKAGEYTGADTLQDAIFDMQ